MIAQFDVHLNQGPHKASIPMVVVVQSSQFERFRRRVVVPLVLRASLPRQTPTVGSRMNPVFKIKGQTLVLHPLDMVSVACDQLGECVDKV